MYFFFYKNGLPLFPWSALKKKNSAITNYVDSYTTVLHITFTSLYKVTDYICSLVILTNTLSNCLFLHKDY